LTINSQRQKTTSLTARQEIEYLNSTDICIICFKSPEKEFVLIKHHITYFPEKIAFVHHACHQKIHDPDKPITAFIQYENGDAKRYYKLRHEQQPKRIEGRIIG